MERTSRGLDEDERTYFREFNEFKALLRAHVDERDGLVCKVEQTNRQLDRLRKTNVFNDAFHIWFDGPFGTVNGFRLGRTPNAPVEWDEINAAWGMACLLLSTMARAAGLTFERTRPETARLVLESARNWREGRRVRAVRPGEHPEQPPL